MHACILRTEKGLGPKVPHSPAQKQKREAVKSNNGNAGPSLNTYNMADFHM